MSADAAVGPQQWAMSSTLPARPRPVVPWRGAGVLALLLATVGCDGGRPLAAQTAGSEQQIERGRVLLAQYQCGSCHAIPGVADARGRQAGTLEAFSARSYIAGRLPNELPVLAAWIADPRALVPTTSMPAMGASAGDALAMAAYLDALE